MTSDLEAKRKLQIWRANTSTLLLNALKMKEGDREIHKKCVLDIVQDVFNALRRLSTSRENDLFDHILHLVKEALDLDKLISHGVAEIKWLYRPSMDVGHFDPDLMEPEPGQKKKK